MQENRIAGRRKCDVAIRRRYVASAVLDDDIAGTAGCVKEEGCPLIAAIDRVEVIARSVGFRVL